MCFVRSLLLTAIALTAFVPASSAAVAGDLDPSFASGGRFTQDFGANHGDGFAGVVVAPSGSIYAAGGMYDDGSGLTRPFVVRFTASGAPDPTFGANGLAILSTATNAYAMSVALQADGKPVRRRRVWRQ